MRLLITYSSRTGNTQKLAEGIYNCMYGIETDIKAISEVKEIDKYTHILVGYWVDSGKPNTEAAEFMSTLRNKKVGIFATLGTYPDSNDAWTSIVKGEDMIKNDNIVIGKYICQGAIDAEVLDTFKPFKSTNEEYLKQVKLKQYEISKLHPNEADILSAAKMFKERLY